MYSTENKSDPKIMRDPNLKHPKMECSKKNSARNSFFPKNSQFQTKTSQRKSHPTGPESTRKCPNCVDRKKFGFRKHPKFWCFCPKISTQKKHCRTRQVSWPAENARKHPNLSWGAVTVLHLFLCIVYAGNLYSISCICDVTLRCSSISLVSCFGYIVSLKLYKLGLVILLSEFCRICYPTSG